MSTPLLRKQCKTLNLGMVPRVYPFDRHAKATLARFMRGNRCDLLIPEDLGFVPCIATVPLATWFLAVT